MKASAGVLLLGATVLALFTACHTVPETGRRSLNLVPEGQMMQMSLSEFENMKQEMPVSTDARINALVRRVGERIAAVADLPDAQWEFVVFEVDQANAFCLPGGKVGVYTGILPITKTEAGLATVIGHEVAHAVAKHGNDRVSRALLTQLGGAVLAAGVSGSEYASVISQVYGVGTQVGLELPHSRSQELEADHIGVLYMAEAGYDPQEAVAFWKRFAEFNASQGSSTPAFLRTHPLDEARIRQLEKIMPEAQRRYQASRR